MSTTISQCRVGGGLDPYTRLTASTPVSSTILAILLVNGAVAAWLVLLGRNVAAPDGSIELWSAGLGIEANSQHLSDPYSAMHLVFGMGLYLFVDAVKPHWPLRTKLVAALAGSGLWEAVENTPAVIALFNDAGMPGAYAGDSIVNSLSDIGFAVLGFFVAVAAPRRAVLAMALVIELAVSLAIADGLVLGTLRTLHLV